MSHGDLLAWCGVYRKRFQWQLISSLLLFRHTSYFHALKEKLICQASAALALARLEVLHDGLNPVSAVAQAMADCLVHACPLVFNLFHSLND